MPRAIQLGRYHLLDRIAFGGMAEIYRAQTYDEIGVPRIVAVKRVLRHLAEDDDFLHMLVDEARIASMLEHKNTAKVYEFGRVGRDYFIAMEYVGGKDVRSIMERCRAESRWVPPEICAFVIKETMHGLHAAHELKDAKGEPLNLIHRDVSPSNIICAYSGKVKLCDFGIAKATLSRVKTRAGVIKGKVKYMSPEQALGRKLDRRSDIFSAGSVLYEMLTRVPPFLAPNEMELILKVRDAKYTPVRERNPTIPPALEVIVDTAMSRSRSSRYSTAKEFARALGGFLENHAKGFRSSHLARFLKSLFRKDIEEEEQKLQEFEVIEADENDLGVNLIADSLGPAAEWSKFSPVPTSSHEMPTSNEIRIRAKKDTGGLRSDAIDLGNFEPPPNEKSVSGFINFKSNDPDERARELERMAGSVEVGELEAQIQSEEGASLAQDSVPAQHEPQPAADAHHDPEHDEDPFSDGALEQGAYDEDYDYGDEPYDALSSQSDERVEVSHDAPHHGSNTAHQRGYEPVSPEEDGYEDEGTAPPDSSSRVRMPVDHDADTALLNIGDIDWEQEVNADHPREAGGDEPPEALHDSPTQILELGQSPGSQTDPDGHYGEEVEGAKRALPPGSPPKEGVERSPQSYFGPGRPTPTTKEDEVYDASSYSLK